MDAKLKNLSSFVIGTSMAFQSQSMEVQNITAREVCDRGEKYFKGLPVTNNVIKANGGTCTLHKSNSATQPVIENIHYDPSFAKTTENLSPEDLFELFLSTQETEEIKARHCLALSALKGYKEAQFALAMYHFYEHKVKDQSITDYFKEPTNFYISFYLFHQAADNGHVNAQCNLGHLYFMGGPKKAQNILNPDYERAYLYFNLAAEQNWTEAKFMLGRMHHEGLYVAKNLKIAKNYFLAVHKEAEFSSLKESSKEKMLEIKKEQK